MSSTTKKKKVQESPRQVSTALKQRMLNVRSAFTLKSYGDVYKYEHPDADMDAVRAVWNLRSTDEKITKNFEALVAKLKAA